MIKTEIRDRIATIELARPDKKNALTAAMYATMTDTLAAAESDPGVRAILIHGTSDCFTAGNDLKDFLEGPAGGSQALRFISSLSKGAEPPGAGGGGRAVGPRAHPLPPPGPADARATPPAPPPSCAPARRAGARRAGRSCPPPFRAAGPRARGSLEPAPADDRGLPARRGAAPPRAAFHGREGARRGHRHRDRAAGSAARARAHCRCGARRAAARVRALDQAADETATRTRHRRPDGGRSPPLRRAPRLPPGQGIP